MRRTVPLAITEFVPLAPRTTLGLGGSARFFAEITDPDQVVEALEFAKHRGLPAFVLGGGANLVVGDHGFQGLVMCLRTRDMTWTDAGHAWLVEAQAGETWDDVAAAAADRSAAGIECLAGIPGTVGAAPVQNIGAYGQEIADTIHRVRVLDRQTMRVHELDKAACAFGYRDSLFKRNSDRFVILSVTLELKKGTCPMPRYAELVRALGPCTPTVADLRHLVLDLRRAKSMLSAEDDPNRRSAGSFFTNPIVTPDIADQVAARALADQAIQGLTDMPRYPAPGGGVKLAAGWLIEKSGLHKGFRMGPVGISSRHALALVHHGGGTTADLLRLATHVRDQVREHFAVVLTPEPVFLGTSWPAS